MYKRQLLNLIVGAVLVSATAWIARAEHHEKDIVDIVVSDASFSTLATAVKTAGLVDALKGEGPLTVFAPTNEAFAKLPAGVLQDLLKPENKEKLQAILTYHVVGAKVPASDVVKMNSARTLNGQQVAIRVEGGKVRVGEANVLRTDILASNGVIHVVDTVILPKDK